MLSPLLLEGHEDRMATTPFLHCYASNKHFLPFSSYGIFQGILLHLVWLFFARANVTSRVFLCLPRRRGRPGMGGKKRASSYSPGKAASKFTTENNIILFPNPITFLYFKNDENISFSMFQLKSTRGQVT